MDSINKFNGLNGTIATREELQQLIKEAHDQEQIYVCSKLQSLLDNNEDQEFEIEIKHSAIECVPSSILNSLQLDDLNEEDHTGLNKPVSQQEIYNMVNDLIINTIKSVGHLPWQKEWIGSGSSGEAKNYKTKKPYTGINFFLTNFKVVEDENGESILVPIKFIQPYYLTFNQIKEAKAKLNEGAKATRVIYYTPIFTYNDGKIEIKTTDKEKWKTFVKNNGITENDLNMHASTIPVVKYYNVFRADDCTGLKFHEVIQNKEVEPIEIAQAIIDNYPNPPKYTFVGDSAHYLPAKDVVNMPKIEAFTDESFFYSTYFHEIVHSTGHSKRLNRGNDIRVRDNSIEDKKAYAFEELVAELGAVYLCSEAGILFHTLENSAKYLKGWNDKLIKLLEEDNRAFFKASAMAQKATNHILDLDENDVAKYLRVAPKEKEKPAKIKPVATKYGKKKKFESKKPVYPFSKDDIPYEKARNAYYWTSFSPEKRAVSEQKNYFEYLKSIYDKYLAEANKKDLKESFLKLFSKFQEGYLKRKLDELNARSRTASSMVTGSANFPVRKNQKALNSHQNKLQELIDYSEKYEKYFFNLLFPEAQPIKSGKANTLERLNEKLADLEKNHALMVKANAEIRRLKKKNLPNEKIIAEFEKYLHEIGFNEKDIQRAVSLPKRENSLVYLGFHTTNSNAEIRRLKQRIEQENKLKIKAETTGNDEKLYFEGGYIFNDYVENRIKIHFDEKPGDEIRSFLKKAGQAFKWSPYNKVWQRQLNTYYRGAKENLFEFLGVKQNPDPTPEKKVEVKTEEKPLKVDENGQIGLFKPKKTIPQLGNIKPITETGKTESKFFTINGEIGNFLQRVEKKPNHSVVITMDGMQGAGKTTTLYKVIDAVASSGNECLFISGEEHPESSLAIEKRDQYLSNEALQHTSIVGEVKDLNQLYEYIAPFDFIFIDSWQKLIRMIGAIRLDEDLRQKFNGKVFVVIFQQTTTGRTKGGAEVVFDGDIIIKMVKEKSFEDNYAYFDKNRYTLVPIENIRYNIASGKCYNPNHLEEPEEPEELENIEPVNFSFSVN